MQQYLQNKKGLVQNVFNQVYDQYDLMNDLMSLGVHRIWKKIFVDSADIDKNHIILDLAAGTGDISKIIANKIEFICP